MLERGDDTPEVIYMAVGRALTQWEFLEMALGSLFCKLISEDHNAAAERAYSSVKTFYGRADMIEAAAEAFFEQHPDAAIQEEVRSVMASCRRASARRNDIAHGIVYGYSDDGVTSRGYFLQTAFWSTKRDSQFNPKYAYTSAQIDAFAENFRPLSRQARGVIHWIRQLSGSSP